MGSFAVGKEPSEASAETFVKQMRVQSSADFAQAKPSERVQSEIKSNSSEARMSVAKQRPRAKRVGEYKPKARIDAFEKRTRRARSGVSNGLRMQTRVNDARERLLRRV